MSEPGRNWSDVEPLECPACGQEYSKKGFNPHPPHCKEWENEVDVPPSEFNAPKHFGVNYFDPSLEEGIDYVECQVCLNEDKEHFRKKTLAYHLKKHDLTKEEYKEAFPDHEVKRDKTKKTIQKRNKKASQEALKHQYTEDGTHVTQTEEAKRKRRQTNKERYGHENVFGGDQGKKRAQKGMLEKHGVTNPQKDPEIREKTEETMREEYDHDEDYFVQSDEFKEKARETCQENWDADHHMKSDEFLEKYQEKIREEYGEDSVLAVPEIYEKSYQSNVENHGGEHHTQTQEHQRKIIRESLIKYGVTNPSKAPEIKQRIKETWEEKYGQPIPPQSLNIELPTSIEEKVDRATPDHVAYTGDFKYWIVDEESGDRCCPDLVCFSEDDYKAYTEGSVELTDLEPQLVIEVNGSFWHGEDWTGVPEDEHEAEQKSFYESRGIDCFVLWEDEIRDMSESELKREVMD
jgi:hypothetical protein